MIAEKIKLSIRKSFWFIIFLFSIIVPIILNSVSQEREIVNYECFIVEYYEYTEATELEVEVEFDGIVNSGEVEIDFYASNGDFLGTKDIYLFGTGKVLTGTAFIDGKVDSFEVKSYYVELDLIEYIPIVLVVDIFVFCVFIGSLMCSCKEYEYDDYHIIVYAGWYHHYIKVDGEKMDELNTCASFKVIYLSCDLEDGTFLDATITSHNRITLKINNRLYKSHK